MENKNMISTLECPNIYTGLAIPEDRSLRLNGNTTRQVDFAIQKLFEGYYVIIQDHYLSGGDIRSNKELLERIQRRLLNEFRVSYAQIETIEGVHKILKLHNIKSR